MERARSQEVLSFMLEESAEEARPDAEEKVLEKAAGD